MSPNERALLIEIANGVRLLLDDRALSFKDGSGSRKTLHSAAELISEAMVGVDPRVDIPVRGA